MRTLMVDLLHLGNICWYDGMFTTSGVGSALGSGSESGSEEWGHGLSCGEGYYEHFSYTTGYIHTGAGAGHAIGAGKDFYFLNEPECDAVPYMKEI